VYGRVHERETTGRVGTGQSCASRHRSRGELATMCIVVEYRESGADFDITAVARAVPQMELVIERWRQEPDDRLSLFIVANGKGFEPV
jgi:hypothetical protein